MINWIELKLSHFFAKYLSIKLSYSFKLHNKFGAIEIN